MNFNDIFKEEVRKLDKEFINGVDNRKVMAICRDNYDLWVNELFPRWEAKGISCHQRVVEIFNENGYKTNVETINTYLSRLHKEFGKKGGRNRKMGKVGSGKTSSIKVEESKVKNSNCDSVIETKSESDVYTKENDWHDTSWIGDEPTDWSIFCLPRNERPKDGEWSDYWENVWRWLFKMGKEEYKMSSFDLSNYAGYKKAMGSDFGDLWLDLSKVRNLDKNKELRLNPKAVGRI